MSEAKVISLVNRRKIRGLEKNIQELTEVTTVTKAAIQGLSKYIHYSDIKKRVNDLFILHQEIKASRQKKLEVLQRLKNEQELEA
jgi:hypothetical protein